MFDSGVLDRVSASGVIAVLVIEDARDAALVASALVAGGVHAIELTLRTAAAFDALTAIRNEVPAMLAGVGTLLAPSQVEKAVQCGAAFGVSPGVNRSVLESARAEGLSFAPGICTPSDIECALSFGCRLLKFFPAEPSGGLPYLKCMASPYEHLGLRYIPLGGIHAENMGEYLAAKWIPAVGGSWLAPVELIREKAWNRITENARQASQRIARIRGREAQPNGGAA